MLDLTWCVGFSSTHDTAFRVMHKDTHTRKPPRSALALPQARSAHDPDLLVLEALLELLQQVHRPRDAGRGESLDGARREASFELASAQQHFEALAGGRHPGRPVALALGGGAHQTLYLRP